MIRPFFEDDYREIIGKLESDILLLKKLKHPPECHCYACRNMTDDEKARMKELFKDA